MRRFLQTAIFIYSVYVSGAFAQTANFTWVPAAGAGTPVCAPIALIFNDNSSGSPTSWSWNFGSGAIPQTSVQQNPGLVAFPSCGIYHVTLTLNNGSTYFQDINIHCPPNACFTATPPTACLGTNFSFNSSCSQSTCPLTYLWDFGDGASSTQANPSHPYTDPNCYTAVLIVTDCNGCADDTTVQNAICITQPPTFQITSSPATTCLSSICVNFFCPTPTGGTPPFSYNWSFPGGVPSTSVAQNPTNICYNGAGAYSISLTVTDASGCSTAVTLPNYVNVGTNSTFINLSNDTVCVGQSIIASTSPGTDYQWSIVPNVPLGNQTTPTATYTFNATGTYIITLHDTVNGCGLTTQATVHVFAQPVASFSCPPVSSCTPNPPLSETVQYNGPAGPWTYTWSFPGSNNPNPAPTTSTAPITVNYSACGEYSISLTVSGPGGCDSTITFVDTVKIDCPTASYEILNLPPIGQYCSPLVLNFDASQSTGSPNSYTWTITPQGGGLPVTQTFPGPMATFTFTALGCYDITLTTNNTITNCGATITNDDINIPICVGGHLNPCLSATPLVSCAPNPIFFTNCTPGVPNPAPPCLHWKWMFGDGGISALSGLPPALPVQHQYTDTGCFDITLISDYCGCADTLIDTQLVCIYPPIAHAVFSIDCDSPNVVLFDGTTSIGADTYTWSFPGGNPSTSNTPTVSVTYPMPNPQASYAWQMIVCNNVTSCCDTAGSPPFVLLRRIDAIASIDTVLCFPTAAVVHNTSVGLNGGGTYFHWEIHDMCNGGGLVAFSNQNFYDNNAGPTGLINFPGPGNYHVTMEEINNFTTCSDTLEWDVVVHGLDPGFWGGPLGGCAPFNVLFHDTTTSNCVSTPANPVDNHWSFGDGGTANDSSNPNHTYTTNGSFTVALTVTDQFGCSSTDSTVAYVNAQVPTVSFYAPDTTVCLGTPVCFQNNSTGTNLSFVWNFGDASGSNQAAPCHTYANTGTYTVTLTATDANGCSATLTKINYIIVGAVNVDFSTPHTFTTCPPLIDTFFINPAITSGCEDYYWSFGDGSFSHLDSPLHIYSFAGTFDVSLIAVDLCNGCSDTVIKPDYITVGGPFSNPLATPDTACAPRLVCFDLNPTNSASFLWDFDDSSPLLDSTSTICHLYNNEGTYYPACFLVDSSGLCSYWRSVDTIVIIVPHAGFYSSMTSVCSGIPISFTDTSDALGGITGWHWDFGDNTSSTLQNPTHFYSGVGDFNVTLTIYTHACPDSVTQVVHVTASPSAVFIPPALGNCPGSVVSFNADTAGNGPICSVLWDFGDPNSGVNNTSILFNATHIFSDTGTFTVCYIAYGCNGCNDSVCTDVTIHPFPVADAGADQLVCIGDSVMLHASGGSPNWSPSNLVTDPNGDSTMAFTPTDTTFILTVTDSNGCQDTDSILITLTIPPSAVISIPADTICYGSSITLTASGGISYIWNTGDTSAILIDTPLVTTTYTVTAYTGSCGDDTTVTITVLPPPPVDAGPFNAFCFGDTTQLAGSGAIGFLWSPDSTLSNDTIPNPFAFPASTTTYTLVGTDANGCTASDTASVLVHPLPVIDAGPDKKICDQTCTQLVATGAVIYSWAPDTFLFASNIYNPIACPTDTITYYVTGTDQFGCVSSDSITIRVLKDFTTTYPGDTCFCLFEGDTLCASGSTINTFHWSPPQGLSATTIPCPFVSPAVSTTYTIIISDELGCFADTGDVSICIYSLPVVDATPVESNILVGTSVTLNGYNTINPGTGTYQWTPDTALSCVACASTIATPLITTSYVVTLTDNNGCKDQDTVLVTVYCNDAVLFVPNAFTPNGDELNNTFHLDGLGIQELKYLRIFNRWGELVYESNDFNAGWDGTVNGKPSEPEVFVYLLEAVCTTGEIIRKQGNITLIR